MDKKIFCDAKTEMVQPHGAELNEDEKSARENDFETSPGFPRQGDEFDLANLIQMKAQISYAMTVVDRDLKVMQDKETVGGRLAACMWILSKTVICNEQRNIEAFRE